MAMPESYRIVLTQSVAHEFQEIFDYIESDSPEHARRMITRLLDAVDSLEIFPQRFEVVQNAVSIETKIRSMPVKPYLIRYHIDDVSRVVAVVSVRHGARE